MKTLTRFALTTIFCAWSVLTAQALTITPSSVPQWTGTGAANKNASEIDAYLLSLGKDVNGVLGEVYTQNVGGSEVGTFASSYTTTFSNSATDPQDALIDYISGPSISGGEIYLYVKDGNQTPSFYIFDISTWNGTDDISMTGFWPSNGAISHVTILTTNGTPSVPESGATVALLGLALASMGLLSRKLKR